MAEPFQNIVTKPGNYPDLPRPYPFRAAANVTNGRLEIYDTPTTLLTA